MLRKMFSSVICLFMIFCASAQDSTSKVSPLTISGSGDLYYKYNFGKSKFNNLTSFTNSHNTFELGMASVKFDYKLKKAELVADLGFGKRAQEFSYNDQGILAAVKQLYISYSVNSWLKFTAGSWATHVGYEMVDASANRNYSMSYMFTNGPFFHTGVKAEMTHGAHGFMVGIANPTDYKYVPDGVLNRKFFIAQYSYGKNDFFKGYLNYVGGQNFDTSKSRQFDVVITSKINNKFSLGYNGTVASSKPYAGNKVFQDSKSWWASAIYLNLDFSSKAGLTLREEYFSDKKGLKYAALSPNGTIFASTLSANFKADGFTLIPEFRIDKSNKSIFVNKDGLPTSTSANILLAAIYQF
jgi:hypothetical protein